MTSLSSPSVYCNCFRVLSPLTGTISFTRCSVSDSQSPRPLTWLPIQYEIIFIISESIREATSTDPEDDPHERALFPWSDEAGDQAVDGPVDNSAQLLNDAGAYAQTVHIVVPQINLTTNALLLFPSNHKSRSFSMADLVSAATDAADSKVDDH